MTSSANTSMTMQISLEKKCGDLESQLSWKNEALDLVEERHLSSEENMALVMTEKDKQSTDLLSFQSANEDLNAQLRDLNRRL